MMVMAFRAALLLDELVVVIDVRVGRRLLDFDHVGVGIGILDRDFVRVILMLLVPYWLSVETLANSLTRASQVQDSDNDCRCKSRSSFHIAIISLTFINTNQYKLINYNLNHFYSVINPK